MWPIINPIDLFGDAVGSVAGWAWDKVIQGIYTWFANGLMLLMQWVWNVLSTATTPHSSRTFATGRRIYKVEKSCAIAPLATDTG